MGIRLPGHWNETLLGAFIKKQISDFILDKLFIRDSRIFALNFFFSYPIWKSQQHSKGWDHLDLCQSQHQSVYGTGCAHWVRWSSLLRAVVRKDRCSLSDRRSPVPICHCYKHFCVLSGVFTKFQILLPFTKCTHRVIRREAASVLIPSGRQECVFWPGRVRWGLEVAQIVNRDIGAWLPPHFTTQRIWSRSQISFGQLPTAFIHLPTKIIT